MKKTKKIIGIGVLVAVIGLLIFGAINRTLAMSEETTTDEQDLVLVDEIYGNGNGTGNGNGNGYGDTVSEENVDETGNGVATGEPGYDVDHTTTALSLEVLPLGELSQAETDALLFMREEEKLARDVYNAMASLWGLPAFSNIASSEQTHMDAVLALIERYGLTDPASDQAGVFTNPDLQNLYTQLVSQGSQSVEEAFQVGAAIEEIDILDLQQRLTQTDQLDIQQVFDSLLNGSYNHLSAFAGNLESRYGIVYVPQYLSQDAYESILATAGETGGSGFRGGGNGNGRP